MSGSYARHTALRPQDDVDIIFVIDPGSWDSSLWTERPDPAAVLESFERAVRYRYPKSRVAVQRRSVRLDLADLSIDIVPAIQDSKDPAMIHVADLKDFLGCPNNDWIPSSPRRHAEIVTEINAANDGAFTKLVKILKFWNSQLPKTARFKSFAVETLAATLFTHHRIESLEPALVLFFDYVAHTAGYRTLHAWRGRHGVSLDTDDFFDLTIPDRGGSGSNLAARLGDDRCDAWVEEAIRARNLVSKGMDRDDPDALQASVRKAVRF